jgi:hypothetical protein
MKYLTLENEIIEAREKLTNLHSIKARFDQQPDHIRLAILLAEKDSNDDPKLKDEYINKAKLLLANSSFTEIVKLIHFLK